MREILEKALFNEPANVFAILDGASIDGLCMKIYETNPPNYCLYRGELAPDMAEVAPYLVGLRAGTAFTEWLLDARFGKHWGIFARSRHSIIEMRKHFRSLVTVHDENGKPLIFRFYDPRVLRTFLPTCNADELKTFFGKVETFFAETGDGQVLSAFKMENNELKQSELN